MEETLAAATVDPVQSSSSRTMTGLSRVSPICDLIRKPLAAISLEPPNGRVAGIGDIRDGNGEEALFAMILNNMVDEKETWKNGIQSGYRC